MLRLVGIAVAVLVLAGFQTQERADACRGGDPAIETLYRDWNAAMARADVDAMLALVEPDFVLVPRVGPPVAQRKELERALWSTFGRARVNASFTCEGRWRQGNVVFEQGWETQTLKPHDGTSRHTSGTTVMLMIRQGADSQWRLAYLQRR